MNRLLLLVSAVLLFSCSVFASETYFKFDVGSRDQIRAATRIVSIDKIVKQTVFAYANDEELSRFAKQGLPYEVLPNPGDLFAPKMASDIRAITAWDSYPTYDAYLAMMSQFAAKYPKLCKLSEIGKTAKGRKLLSLKITSDAAQTASAKPEFFYSSTMHGDEVTGYVLMLHMIDYLLNGYGTDPKVTQLLNETELWITPLANPDGTYYGGNNTVQGARRYNGNSIDPNRNFPDPEAGQHPDGNAWQPETVAMMKFADAHHFVMGANFHGGAEVINYPWDTWEKAHVDQSWFEQISGEYVDLVHKLASDYMTDQNNGMTNGYAWYEVKGGRQDYMNYFKNCREMTIELSSVKLADAAQLPNYWSYNKDSFLDLIAQAQYGINGVVRDAKTKKPLEAKIEIDGHDGDNSFVTSKADFGTFYRPIVAGTYQVKFSAPNHDTKIVKDVVVKPHEAVKLDIEM